MNKKIVSQETKDKIRKGHIGKKHSQETKDKIRKSLRERVTPKIRKKMSIIAKKRIENMSLKDKQKFFNRIHKIKSSNNPNPSYWKHRLMGIKKYSEWRNSILKRDNFTCTLCGKKNNLVVHHKEPIINIVKANLSILQSGNFDIPEIWDIRNGITRCEECHETIDHNRQSKKKKLKILLIATLKEPINENLKREINKYLAGMRG